MPGHHTPRPQIHELLGHRPKVLGELLAMHGYTTQEAHAAFVQKLKNMAQDQKANVEGIATQLVTEHYTPHTKKKPNIIT